MRLRGEARLDDLGDKSTNHSPAKHRFNQQSSFVKHQAWLHGFVRAQSFTKPSHRVRPSRLLRPPGGAPPDEQTSLHRPLEVLCIKPRLADRHPASR